MKIVTRGARDRLRYVLLFEGFLILLVGFVFSRATDHRMIDTAALAAVLSIKAMIINYGYNYCFDRLDMRFGRVPTERGLPGRVVHAVLFEVILSATSLPILIWWLDLGLWAAFLLDVSMMSVIVVFTFVFSLAYDRVFPISQNNGGIESGLGLEY